MNWLINAAGTTKEIYSESTIHGQIPNIEQLETFRFG